MTNLKFNPVKLKPIQNLLEHVNFDEGRIEVSKGEFISGCLYLTISDKYTGKAACIELSAEQVTDMVDEYEPKLHLYDIDNAHYYWLKGMASDIQRRRLFDKMAGIVIYHSVSEMNVLQYA